MEKKTNAKDSGNDERAVDVITREQREKIVSKMDVTKFFAGFISLLIGILFGEERMNSVWSRVGIISFLLSLGFCVAAISAYDHLLSTKEYLVRAFWPELSGKPNWQKLFQEKWESQLACYWKFLFVPALIFFGVGFAFLLMQELGPQVSKKVGDKGYFGLFIFLAIIFAAPTGVLFAKWGFDKKRSKH